MSESAVRRILFVCLGNICRSPAGEGIFRHLVAERGLTRRIEIDSAGTIDYHDGEPADARMRAAAARRGYSLDSRARGITRRDIDDFDLIVTMDSQNLADVRRVADGRDAHIVLLSDFLPRSRWPRDVPDPYYGGEDGFEHVLDMIEAACPAILERLLASGAPATNSDEGS